MDRTNTSMISKSGRIELPPQKENWEEYLYMFFIIFIIFFQELICKIFKKNARARGII